MAESTSTTQGVLIRDDVWSQQIQELLQEELMGQKIVEMVTDFPK